MSDLPAPTRRRWGVGAILVLVVVAVAITVVVGLIRTGFSADEPVPVVSISDTPTDSAMLRAPDVFVHVAGAVRAPGLYRLSEGSRVVDAIGAAGGFAPDAEPAALNLARPVVDGEQVLVPLVGEPLPVTTAAGAAVGPVNVNTADVGALESLPGIGPALAQRIVDWRDANGAFSSIDDLEAVSGIGPTIVEGLRDLATV